MSFLKSLEAANLYKIATSKKTVPAEKDVYDSENTLLQIRKRKALLHNEQALVAQSPISKLSHWSTAIVLDPDPVYFYQRAEVLALLGDLDASIRNYREFERICNSAYVMRRYSQTLYIFGICLLDQFRWKEVF